MVTFGYLFGYFLNHKFSNAGMMALLNGSLLIDQVRICCFINIKSLLFMCGFFPSNQKVQFLSQSWLSILESWPWFNSYWLQAKGQLHISKAINSSRKLTNGFVFTTMGRVFVCFLEEIKDTKKTFWNYLTFNAV